AAAVEGPANGPGLPGQPRRERARGGAAGLPEGEPAGGGGRGPADDARAAPAQSRERDRPDARRVEGGRGGGRGAGLPAAPAAGVQPPPPLPGPDRLAPRGRQGGPDAGPLAAAGRETA